MNRPGRKGELLTFDAAAALRHLADKDPKLGAVIEEVGPLALSLRSTKSTFEALAEAIVYQQLHAKAAATIHGRVAALFPRGRLAAGPLLAIDDDALRAAGLSRNKTLAMRDLAVRTLDGTVPPFARLQGMTDDAIVERLVQVRGVGRWTVEMILIFRLGRPDVLPIHDYGVRHGFKVAYRKRAMPTPKALELHGERWRPFRTVASWYLWRAADLSRPKPKAK